MKKAQIDLYNMLHRVETHFNINVPIWSDNAMVSETKTALSAKIKEINAAALVQSDDSTGATMDKTVLRNDLEEKGFFVSSSLTAYVNMNPSQALLYKRLKITRSRFTKLREADLLLAIEDLNDAAESIIESLVPYGVSPATLTELMAARDAFHEIRTVPEQITAIRKDATRLVAQLLREGAALLEDQMDHLMPIFKATEPQFRNVYFIDRAIRHIGTRHLSLSITTLNADGGAPLAKAEIEVVGHGIKRISSQSGLNKVKNLKEGYYTLKVSHPDFISQTIPFSIVGHQTTEVVAKLEKVSKPLRI